MTSVDAQDIADSLRHAGVRQGETLLVHADITRIGLVRGASSRQDYPQAYLDGLRLAVGPEGTIAALACTESWARQGRPYVHEDSPSEQGVLAEHIRTRPGAVRSVHPLFSVCALGPGARALCADASPCAFGFDSPFARLLDAGARIVCLGVDLLAMTFVHHVEQRFGVPYGYTKEWTAPAFKDGQPLAGRYFAFVRYLDSGVEYDFTRLQELLLARGLARRAPLGLGAVHAVACAHVFNTVMEALRRDVFFLLRRPPEREPWKGARMPGFE